MFDIDLIYHSSREISHYMLIELFINIAHIFSMMTLFCQIYPAYHMQFRSIAIIFGFIIISSYKFIAID